MGKQCLICGCESFKEREGVVRDNPELEIIECTFCGLVSLWPLPQIDEGFYEDSGMHMGEVDIEKWRKGTKHDDKRRFQYLEQSITNKNILDFGCGNGGFLLLARERAKAVAGVELEKALQKYFKENKLDVFPSIGYIERSEQKFDVITMFHVLEHLPNPIEILSSLKNMLNKKGEIIIEVPHANDSLLNLYDCKEFKSFTYWSCHLYLHTYFTLEKLAKKCKMRINYIKQIQRYPLSNHLYWLSKGKPGGHEVWSFLDSDDLHIAYEKQLASLGLCDTLIASFTVE